MGDVQTVTKTKLLPVVQVFGPTIQGEGEKVGTPCVFVRLGGCDYRCSWCDTMYAVDPSWRDTWTMRPAVDVAARAAELMVTPYGPKMGGNGGWVVLSGGNPSIHNLAELIAELHKRGLYVTMETQGSIVRDWWDKLDWITLSPKPPSSDWTTKPEEAIKAIKAARIGEVKVVVFDSIDLDYAHMVRTWTDTYNRTLTVNLSCGTKEKESREDTLARYRWLIEASAGMGFDRVLPQLHVITWGHDNER